jgi:type IX secretion system substrate protein
MKNHINFFQRKRFHLTILLLIAGAGLLVFQAQDITNTGNELIYDQPPGNLQYAPQPPVNPVPSVITDAFGYDNFDIGAHNAEQWITQNPNNQFHMIFGVNSTNWFHTEDGYAWAYNNPTASSSGDPIAAYDSLNNGYAQLLGSGNRVWRTTNNGITWGPGVPSVAGGDRNTMAADQTNGPFANYVYASAWSPNANFARSTDFGATWTTTVTGAPNQIPGNMIAVGPNGSIQGGCVYWACITGTSPPGAPSTYHIYRSTNGGLNFTAVDSTIMPGWVGVEGGSRLTINNCRTRPYPFLACDNSYGPFRGRFYVVYASNVPAGNGNKPDIKCQYSTNQGNTFSAPVIVNDNASPELSDQWFPAVWCDRYTGKLYVKWYDDRNNPTTYGVDVYASYSTNGGVSFVTNQKLTTVNWVYPSPPVTAGSYCGDYDGMVGNKFSAFALWTDMRNSTRANMGAYFPDFAMKVNPTILNVSNFVDSAIAFVSIPGVKLFSDVAKFTATVSPPPAGSITLTFLHRSSQTLKDSITAFPDSIRLRVQTSDGVTPGAYTITVTGTGRIGGQNGPPIHRRTITLNVGLVGITNQNGIPENYYLYQNYPNPFNPNTSIRFDLAKGGFAKITVYDISGKEVTTLSNGIYRAGKHSVDFKAESFSSGIYFYKLETSEFTAIRKMILIK